MAKEDLKLRVTSNAPLTTKGSPLTWAELDSNWINIYNAFGSLSQSSYIDAYSASVTYDDTIRNYAMYSNQLWKCIAASPIIAITPTEGANWTKVYATDLVGKNVDLNVKRYKALISNTNTFTQSGLLVIGKEYVIVNLSVGDDFTNIGYVSEGDSFIATGTTPTTWTNLTKVTDIAASQPTVTELVNTCGTVNVSWYFDNITTGDFIINFNQVGLFADTLFAPHNFLLNYPLVKFDDDNAYTVVSTGSLTDFQVAFEIYT